MVQLAVSKAAPKGKGRQEGTLGAKKIEELSREESRNQLFEGVSISDLTIIFRLDRRTIQDKIASVPACGKRRGFAIWKIRDVAPYLVRPAGNIEETIKAMRPNDLPPLLSKEFWNGQRSKLRYHEEVGQLWRTDRVIGVLGEVFKTIKMNLLLVPDALERKTTLTEQQREEVRLAIDGTLEEIRDELVGQFKDDDQGPGEEEPGDALADDTFEDEFADEDEWDPPIGIDTGDL